MSRKFYATTNYAGLAPMDDDQVATIAAMLIDTGVMLVAEVDGAVVGMIGLAVMPFTFNPALTIAAEVVWWVEPDAQRLGLGRALLAAVEPAALERGARAVQMMTLATSPPLAAALYEHMGFEHSETSFTKRID
jgi:GNAT superfamily N-acetyltransferase